MSEMVDQHSYNWCSWCGGLWAPKDCNCHPDGLRPFPPELRAAVAAARAIGGHDAVHDIERELYHAQPHPVHMALGYRKDER